MIAPGITARKLRYSRLGGVVDIRFNFLKITRG